MTRLLSAIVHQEKRLENRSPPLDQKEFDHTSLTIVRSGVSL
jgi:hypothetical protein